MQPRAIETSARRRSSAGSILAICVLVSMPSAAGLLSALAAQEPGERVELTPGEVTAERLIELLAPPADARGLAIGVQRRPGPPRCEVYRQRLTRGIKVAATTPIPTIQFAFNSNTISPEAAKVLGEMGKALSSATLASSCFSIEGHTDSVGSDSVNDRLSRKRAEAAVHFLIARFDIEPQRLAAVGRGKRQPIAENDTDAGRQRNRRVEIVNMGAGESQESQ